MDIGQEHRAVGRERTDVDDGRGDRQRRDEPSDMHVARLEERHRQGDDDTDDRQGRRQRGDQAGHVEQQQRCQQRYADR